MGASTSTIRQSLLNYAAMEFTNRKDNAFSLKEKLKRFDN